MRGIIVAFIFVAAVLGIPGETTAIRVLYGCAALYALVLAVPPFRSFGLQLIRFMTIPLFAVLPAALGCLIGTGVGWIVAAIRGISFTFGDIWVGGACGALIAAWGAMGVAKRSPEDSRRISWGLLFGGILSAGVTSACSVSGGWKALLAGTAICVLWSGNYVASRDKRL